jgi:hypothetical protein
VAAGGAIIKMRLAASWRYGGRRPAPRASNLGFGM